MQFYFVYNMFIIYIVDLYYMDVEHRLTNNYLDSLYTCMYAHDKNNMFNKLLQVTIYWLDVAVYITLQFTV